MSPPPCHPRLIIMAINNSEKPKLTEQVDIIEDDLLEVYGEEDTEGLSRCVLYRYLLLENLLIAHK